MSKLPINTPISNMPPELAKTAQISTLADRLVFVPSLHQRKIKAVFWSKFQPSPLISFDSITCSYAAKVTGAKQLQHWWETESGFKEWFLNREEGREKLEYLFMLALDTAEKILLDDSAQASAKVNMIKVLAELSNKFPNKYAEKYADEEITKMDERQLKAYLDKKGIIYREERVITAESEDKSDAKKNDQE